MEIEPKFNLVKYGPLENNRLVLKPADGGKSILGIKATECLVALSLNATRAPVDQILGPTPRPNDLVFDLSEAFRITPSSDCADYTKYIGQNDVSLLTLILGAEGGFLTIPAKSGEAGRRLLNLKDGSFIDPPDGYLVAVSYWEIRPVAIDREVTVERVEPMEPIFTFSGNEIRE